MNPWKQGGQMTIRINHEDSSVELTRPKESDTWRPVLDMCYDAVRALGFVFESPDELLDKQERLLGQIHEAVEQYIPFSADVDSVLDGVRKAIDYLVDEGAKAKRLLEEKRAFGVTQQLGIVTQKKRIEELDAQIANTSRRIRECLGENDPNPDDGKDVVDAVYRTVQRFMDERAENRRIIKSQELELDKIRPLAAPSAEDGGIWNLKVRKGTFLWAAAMVDAGRTVRSRGWKWSPNHAFVIGSEGLTAQDWEISP